MGGRKILIDGVTFYHHRFASYTTQRCTLSALIVVCHVTAHRADTHGNCNSLQLRGLFIYRKCPVSTTSVLNFDKYELFSRRRSILDFGGWRGLFVRAVPPREAGAICLSACDKSWTLQLEFSWYLIFLRVREIRYLG